MVKKSLFARLFHLGSSGESEHGPERTRSRAGDLELEQERRRDEPAARSRLAGTGVAAKEANGNGSRAATAPRAPAGELQRRDEAPAIPSEEHRPADGPPVKASKMSREEELSLKLKEGFQGISSVLTGIDKKIDQQQQTSSELMVQVQKIPELMKDVPDASKAGLELLAAISTVLDSQGRATRELLEKVGDLPRNMEQFEERLQSQLEASARAGADTRQEVASAVKQMGARVDTMAESSGRKHDELVRELRRQQGEHDRRVDQLLKRSASATRLVVFLIIVVIAALLLVVHQLGQG